MSKSLTAASLGRLPKSVRLARNVVAFSVLGALAASCSKSSGGKKGETPSSASEPVGQPLSKSGKSESERREEREQFDALQARLEALEGQRSNVTPADIRVSGDVTLPKSLLGKELLWGSDLQYAKVLNYGTGAFEASTVFALTTKVAAFKRVGRSLLLISRDASEVESDYPAENILARFLIVSESGEGLSLKADALGLESSRVIGDWLGVTPIEGAKAFVRSMEFDSKDDTLVFEITFRDASGA